MNELPSTGNKVQLGGVDVHLTSEKIISADDVMTTFQEIQDGVHSRDAYFGNVLSGFQNYPYTDIQCHFPFETQESFFPTPTYDSFCLSPHSTNEKSVCSNNPNMHQTTDPHFLPKLIQSIEPFVNIGNDSSFVSLLEQTHPLEANSSISTTVYGEPEMNSSTGSQKMALQNMTSQLSITQHVSLPVTSDHDLHPRESMDQGRLTPGLQNVDVTTATPPEVTWQTSPKSFLDLDDQPQTSDAFFPFLNHASNNTTDRCNPQPNSPHSAFRETPKLQSYIQPGVKPANGEYLKKTQPDSVVTEEKNCNLDMSYLGFGKEASSAWCHPLSPQSPIPAVFPRDSGPFDWTPSTMVIRNLNFGCGGTTTALMPAGDVSTSKGCVSNLGCSNTDWDVMYRSGRQFWDGLESCGGCDFRVPEYVPPPMGLEVGQFVGKTGSLSPDDKDTKRMRFNETGSDDSLFSDDVADDEDEKFLMEMLPKKASKSCKKTKRGCRLWEFIRDLLLDSSTNPSIIRWENREVGTFRLVKSKAIARIWGMKKGNEAMNYEKLSRAMRYYYKRQVFQPVIGKRLVYSFGPRATGWRD